MKSLIVIALVFLTGCATNCREACILGIGPGNSFFDAVALHYDKNDPCQNRPELDRPQGYQLPNWCGHRQARRAIMDAQGRTVGYIR